MNKIYHTEEKGTNSLFRYITVGTILKDAHSLE